MNFQIVKTHSEESSLQKGCVGFTQLSYSLRLLVFSGLILAFTCLWPLQPFLAHGSLLIMVVRTLHHNCPG